MSFSDAYAKDSEKTAKTEGQPSESKEKRPAQATKPQQAPSLRLDRAPDMVPHGEEALGTHVAMGAVALYAVLEDPDLEFKLGADKARADELTEEIGKVVADLRLPSAVHRLNALSEELNALTNETIPHREQAIKAIDDRSKDPEFRRKAIDGYKDLVEAAATIHDLMERFEATELYRVMQTLEAKAEEAQDQAPEEAPQEAPQTEPSEPAEETHKDGPAPKEGQSSKPRNKGKKTASKEVA